MELRSAEQVGRGFKFRLERSNVVIRAPFFAGALKILIVSFNAEKIKPLHRSRSRGPWDFFGLLRKLYLSVTSFTRVITPR